MFLKLLAKLCDFGYLQFVKPGDFLVVWISDSGPRDRVYTMLLVIIDCNKSAE